MSALVVRSSGSAVGQTHARIPALPLTLRASAAHHQAALSQLWKGTSNRACLTGQPGLNETEKVGKLAQTVLSPENGPNTWLL